MAAMFLNHQFDDYYCYYGSDESDYGEPLSCDQSARPDDYGYSYSESEDEYEEEEYLDNRNKGKQKSEPKDPLSLLDLTAIVIAKHNDCEQLEQCQLPLDEALMKKVAFHAFPKCEIELEDLANLTEAHRTKWSKGANIWRYGHITMMQVGFSAIAYISRESSSDEKVKVFMTFEKQHLLSSRCFSCKDSVMLCKHVIAAALFHIRNPEKVKVYAPLMDSLSALNRSQMQKLVQYAVNEEPLFLMNVFKHFDDVRDGNSSLNKIEGAPDLTIGGRFHTANSDQVMKAVSLELERGLARILEMRKSGRGSANSKMCNDKHEDPGDSYVHANLSLILERAIGFHRAGYTELGLNILKLILETSIDSMHETPAGVLCSRSQLLHQFLVKYVSGLLVHPSMLQSDQKDDIFCFIEKHVRDPSAKKQPSDPSTNWACLPSLSTLFGDEFQDLQCTVLAEVFCVKEVLEWPNDLKDLLHGKVSFKASTYHEHPSVMMLRLESLQTFKTDDYTGEHLSRLALAILLQLIGSAVEDSSLKISLAKLGYDSVEARRMVLKHGLSTVLREISPLKKSREINNNEMMEVDGSSYVSMLSKSELAYSIVTVCGILRNRLVLEWLPADEQDNLVGYCLLGIEANRSRLAARDNATQSDQRQLLKLEQQLQYYILEKTPVPKSIVNLFLDAVCECGIAWFAPEYPLVLISTLVYLATLDEEVKTKRHQDILQLCSDLILVCTANVIATLTPKTAPGRWRTLEGLAPGLRINSLGNQRGWRDYSPNNFKEFAWHQCLICVKIFLDLVHLTDIKENILCLKVIPQLSEIVTAQKKFADVIASELWKFVQKNIDKFSQKLAEEVLCILLKCAAPCGHRKFYESYVSRENQHRQVCSSLIPKVGCSSLHHIRDCWQQSISPKDLGIVLLQLKPNMGPTHKSDFSSLVLDYLGQSNHIETEHAVELMSIFEYGDENYSKAFSAISKNASAFEPDFIFDIAYRESRQKMDVMYMYSGKGHQSDKMSKEIMFMLKTYTRKAMFGDIPVERMNLLCRLYCETYNNVSEFATMFKNCVNLEVLHTLLVYIENMQVRYHKGRHIIMNTLTKLYTPYFTLLMKKSKSAANLMQFSTEVARARSALIKHGTSYSVSSFDAMISQLRQQNK